MCIQIGVFLLGFLSREFAELKLVDHLVILFQYGRDHNTQLFTVETQVHNYTSGLQECQALHSLMNICYVLLVFWRCFCLAAILMPVECCRF